MTSWLRALCMTAVALAAVVPVASAQAVKSDQEILIEMERAWDAAFHRQDAKFIETVLAPEFIATYGDGTRGDRAKELSLAADVSQQVDSSRLDEFTVKTYGNTAVVWFTQHLVGPVKGKPVEVNYRYIDVWVNRDGRWLCVASQSTRVSGK
ncbi:MAG TPA: nuclear transport factor 2 family protein [Vicinamibacterales bacterium]|nr:nuclear transport factor 2 family protein [Vicinamibacterales bacterium]